MDNLAHTLAGAALAESGLKRRTSLGMATLLIGANLPDLDVLALLTGSGLSFRRGWTHGVLAIAVLPMLLAGAMVVWDRVVRRRGGREPASPVRPRQLLLLAFVGVLSHPVLDWLNTYGMRWLMPFDGRWFYGDALFIVDPWLWLILGAGVLIARRWGSPRAGLAGVMVATIYAGLMVGTAVLGERLVEDGVRAEGVSPDVVMVGPVLLNPNRRQVVLRQGFRYYTGTLTWLPRPRLVVDERVVDANWDHPAAMRAAELPQARNFLTWARLPFFVVAEQADGYTVRIDDMRYSDGTSPSWAAVEVEVSRSAMPAPDPAVASNDSSAAVPIDGPLAGRGYTFPVEALIR
ncbi:MAG: metal-dependent hydrolase [Gemmatimonadota bacterium]